MRLRGTLIGLAVGDALGAAIEFKEPGDFDPVTGYRAGGPHRLNPGEWTDDPVPHINASARTRSQPAERAPRLGHPAGSGGRCRGAAHGVGGTLTTIAQDATKRCFCPKRRARLMLRDMYFHSASAEGYWLTLNVHSKRGTSYCPDARLTLDDMKTLRAELDKMIAQVSEWEGRR